MGPKWSSVAAFAGLLFCGGALTSGAAPEKDATAKTAVKTMVIVYAPDHPLDEKSREIEPSILAGRYYAGDGLGYNLDLVLAKGGKFECTWRGCLGVYGKTSGDWALDERGLTFSPVKGEGNFAARALGRVRIVAFRDRYLLLQERDRGRFEKVGPMGWYCFHKQGDGELLEEEFQRRIKAAAAKDSGR
jgi:hypothetical protein